MGKNLKKWQWHEIPEGTVEDIQAFLNSLDTMEDGANTKIIWNTSTVYIFYWGY